MTQELGGVAGLGHPGGQSVAADRDSVIPMTGPRPAPAHIRAASASTLVFPDPAGALITETRFPSVSPDSTAAA